MNVNDEDSYSKFVGALAKNPSDIISELTEEGTDLWHAATGVSGEAGELLDAIKKVCCYRKQMDRENVIEELGDLEFYMQMIRSRIGVTREEVIAHNVRKLGARYHEGRFSNRQAQERADKAAKELTEQSQDLGITY